MGKDDEFKIPGDPFEWMKAQSEKGCEEDEIPAGFGEFGYEVTNPIPARTITGSRVYLEHLQTAYADAIR